MDSLRVTLAVSLSTRDGAIEISGELTSQVSREESAPQAYGSLDLSQAYGTLRLAPGRMVPPHFGYVNTAFRFWPSAVRGQVWIGIAEKWQEGDVPGYWYHPLEGRFPIDHCGFDAWPFAPSEPGATPSGASAREMRDDLQRRLDAAGPLRAGWNGHYVTQAETAVGSPAAVCQSSDGSLTYLMPLTVTSADGQIRVNELARGGTVYAADGSFEYALLDFHSNVVLAADFPRESGVSGLDLRDLPAVHWYTSLSFGDQEGPEIHGIIGVEGVDLYGEATGRPGAIIPPFPAFRWSE